MRATPGDRPERDALNHGAREMRAPLASSGDGPVPFTQVHRVLRSWLERAQDVIVVGLAVILFGVMIRNLIGLGRYVLGPAINFRDILGETLFMMMLIELLRLLVLYLRDHHVAVDVMVRPASSPHCAKSSLGMWSSSHPARSPPSRCSSSPLEFSSGSGTSGCG